MDVIYNAKQLGPGENYPFSIKFMIFSGLTNIRELAGNTAVDCAINKKDGQREIEMRFATSCDLPEGEFKLKINGKITHQIQMPALRPGNTFTCSFACPALADKCEIGGSCRMAQNLAIYRMLNDKLKKRGFYEKSMTFCSVY